MNGLKKETESPYRKVVVKTDLKSDFKPSKTPICTFNGGSPWFRKKNTQGTSQWRHGGQWGS